MSREHRVILKEFKTPLGSVWKGTTGYYCLDCDGTFQKKMSGSWFEHAPSCPRYLWLEKLWGGVVDDYECAE